MNPAHVGLKKTIAEGKILDTANALIDAAVVRQMQTYMGEVAARPPAAERVEKLRRDREANRPVPPTPGLVQAVKDRDAMVGDEREIVILRDAVMSEFLDGYEPTLDTADNHT